MFSGTEQNNFSCRLIIKSVKELISTSLFDHVYCSILFVNHITNLKTYHILNVFVILYLHFVYNIVSSSFKEPIITSELLCYKVSIVTILF